MIMETAQMTIKPGESAAFEAALEQAKTVLAKAPGFQMIHVHKGIERPDTYLLAIGWAALTDHTVGFRESELFTQWRALIGPYFAEAPQVEHWELFAD